MNESTFCQSCGMPLNDPNLLGSELNGFQSDEYCKYCYEDGAFTQPNLTIEGMKEILSALYERKRDEGRRSENGFK